MAEDKFKLPGSSYAELTKIIQAYGELHEPSTNDAVSKIAAVHTTVVSRNNGFLAQIGVLEGGQKKALTDAGRRLAQALAHEMPDEIRTHWRSVVAHSEFLNKVLSAIRIRRGMDVTSAQSHIAYTAGAKKTANAKTGAATVLDILRATELLTESTDGHVTVATASDVSETGQPNSADMALPPGFLSTSEVGALATAEASGATTALTTHTGSVSIQVHVRVDCKPEDLESLGAKLRQLLKDTTASDVPDSNSDS